MKEANRKIMLRAGCLLLLVGVAGAGAQDWPQWLGPNRDGKAAGFTAPQSWPEAMTKKWATAVGEGCSSPVLVGDHVYVFSRADGNEVLQCLDASTGTSLWQESYPVPGFSGPDARDFSGPRSTPAVAEGKIVTFGVTGILSCYDQADHQLLWRKDEFPGQFPRFHTSASPIVADGLCIALVGGPDQGALVAYELDSGERRWAWTGDGPAYGSPVLTTVDGVPTVVTLTDKKVAAVNAADGSLLWDVDYVAGRRAYNAATPLVEGRTMVYAGMGRGTTAVRFSKDGDGLAAEQAWANPDNAVQYNSPVLKDGLLFSVSSRNDLVCIDAKDGRTAWTHPIGGQRGYGNIVDAGPVLLVLTSAAELTVFEPDAAAYKQVAVYPMSDGPTYAFPAVSGNRVFVKGTDAVTLWAF